MAIKREAPKAPPPALTEAEMLYMKLADALHSAQEWESAAAIRGRVLAGASEATLAELTNLVTVNRAKYTKL